MASRTPVINAPIIVATAKLTRRFSASCQSKKSKVTSISEITGMEGDIITMQEIYVFEKAGVTQDGKVIGRFRATGVRPKCCERLRACGINLPADMFEGVTEVR